ncbi:PIN domain-containing protein [Nanoarchaeota archaeon]
MKEIIDSLERVEKVDYLLDTCFVLYMFMRGRVRELEKFCKHERVGMTSFNLLELDHVVHKMPGPISRHVRDFLKKKILLSILVGVEPGDREGERKFVQDYDVKLLDVVPDPSDAVMIVVADKIRADVISRDRHHVFTAVAENYSNRFRVLNKIE